MNLFKKNIFFYLYVSLLILTNILILNNFFIDYTFRNTNFSDLQWFPSVLFSQNIDVYKLFYENKLQDLTFRSSFPNYSTVSIYIHLIISKMSFENAVKIWFLLFNLIMIYLYRVLKNKTDLKEIHIFLILIFFIFSKPYMQLLSSGQFSIISFFAFFLYFFFKKEKKFIGYFLISIKYSFLPIILIYDLIRYKRLTFFIFTLILSLIFVLHYTIYFGSNFFDNLVAPLLIGKATSASGVLDLQTLLGNFPNNDFLRYVLIFIIGTLAIIIIYKYTNREIIFDLSICSLLTLLIFKHLYYDFVLLLPVLIYSIVKTKKFVKILIILIIFYFWFLYLNVYSIPFLYSKIFQMINFVILSFLLFAIVFTNLKKPKYKN